MNTYKLKSLALLAALLLPFSFAACSSGDDSGGSSDTEQAGRTYTEASAEEKALFAVTYGGETVSGTKAVTLTNEAQRLSDIITVQAQAEWYVEEFGEDWDSWVLLLADGTADDGTAEAVDMTREPAESESKVTGEATGDTAATFSLHIERNGSRLATDEAPDERTTTLHFLSKSSGKRVAAITLTQKANAPSANISRSVTEIPVSRSDHEFIGYGYNVFASGWANPDNLENYSIISAEKIAKSDKTSLKFQENNRTTHETRSGKSLAKLTQTFSLDANVSAEIFTFSGEVSAKYKNDREETGEEEYAIMSYNVRRGTYFLDNAKVIDGATYKGADGKYHSEYLTDEAFDAIYGYKPNYAGAAGIKNLIDNYGTHVIVSGIMGGRIDYAMRVNKSVLNEGYSIEGCVSAGYKSVWGSAKVKVESKYEKKMEESKEETYSYTSVIGGTVTTSEAEWEASLAKDNTALMDFQNKSLVPIWKLCLDPVRAEAIRQYINQYGGTWGKSGGLTGSIVLSDGTAVDKDSYTLDPANPPIGVIAFMGTGGELGRQDNAYILGLKQLQDRTQKNGAWHTGWNWIVDGHYYATHKNLPVGKTSNYDGSLNFSSLKAKMGKRYAKGDLPALEFAEKYGTKAGLSGTKFATGWFVPSRAELKAICRNYSILSESLKLIPGADNFITEGSTTPTAYWSSSVADGASVWTCQAIAGEKAAFKETAVAPADWRAVLFIRAIPVAELSY